MEDRSPYTKPRSAEGCGSFRCTNPGVSRSPLRSTTASTSLTWTSAPASLPIQAMVDKVTMWFVPAVMGVAALTFLVWLIFGPDPALTFALVNAVAVLIVVFLPQVRKKRDDVFAEET